MQYMIPDDYDSFRCLADRCPDTCCRGWRISIDEASLKKYAKMKGLIGNRLRNSVDWHNGIFRLYGGMCVLLEDGLCGLQLEAGEEALCDTCRQYPRHEEEYDHVRERSLSLSCPEAARMTVFRETPLRFTEWETDEEDDFDEFDAALFEQLRELRSTMICIAQNRNLPLTARLRQITVLGQQAQSALAEGLEQAGSALEGGLEQPARPAAEADCLKQTGGMAVKEGEAEMEDLTVSLLAPTTLKAELSLLRELPVRDDRWQEILDCTWEQLCLAEDKVRLLTGEWMKKYETAGEQILVQFLYVYLCGAVYDRQISAKSSLAVRSVVWIFLVSAGNALAEPGMDAKKLLTEVTWRLARLIEHDDENLARLESTFD